MGEHASSRSFLADFICLWEPTIERARQVDRLDSVELHNYYLHLN